MYVKEKLKKIGDNVWELSKEGDMKVPARIFISEKMLKAVEENAIQQLVNISTLPGIQKYALAMPDIHSGF